MSRAGLSSRERAFAAIRRARGWSREYAAAMIGISTRYLHDLERGRAPLSLALACRMAAAYRVTLTCLTLPPGAGGARRGGRGGARPARGRTRYDR